VSQGCPLNRGSLYSYSKSIWPSIFSRVTFPIDFFVLVSNHRLHNGKGSLLWDVMFAGSQTVLNVLGDGVRRLFDHDRIWKELVMDAWIIDCTWNTTWQPQLVDDYLQIKRKKAGNIILSHYYRRIFTDVIVYICAHWDTTSHRESIVLDTNWLQTLKELVNQLTPEISPKNAVFSRSISFFGCHDAKWASVLLKTHYIFHQKDKFPAD